MSSTARIRLVTIGAPGDLQARLADRTPLMTVIPVDITDDVVAVVTAARPDIVLLSKAIGLRSATWLCRALKEREPLNRVPIVLYGFGDDPASENAAFAAGADDYVARSGTATTIAARINAILRRSTHARLQVDHRGEETLRIGQIHLQNQGYAATVAGRTIPLTVSEFRILWKLARSAGITLAAAALAPLAGNLDRGTPERSVRSHICALRRKLGPAAGRQIQTVRNAGYRLSDEQD